MHTECYILYILYSYIQGCLFVFFISDFLQKRQKKAKYLVVKRKENVECLALLCASLEVYLGYILYFNNATFVFSGLFSR